jgi:hypothetical protein
MVIDAPPFNDRMDTGPLQNAPTFWANWIGELFTAACFPEWQAQLR